jgi:hypothetical protein
LGTLQDEKFEEKPVIVDRHAPFFVMIGDVPLVGCPVTAVERYLKSLFPPGHVSPLELNI